MPCFLVAEAGSNHNGDLKTALKLIDAASDAGADAIKFQVFYADRHYSKKTPRHSNYNLHLYDLVKQLELPRDWLKTLKEHADRRGIIFFASPCDYEAVDLLEELGIPLYKISSFEIVDLELISYIASKSKPVIISTGLANMEEIEDAYLACKKAGNDQIIFLQCASVYPASPELMNLNSMRTLFESFKVITGLSDHTSGIHVSVAAVAMGAKLIEKHFTLNREMKGPDHSFAVEPDELKSMIKHIRDVESAFGDGMKLGPKPEEMEYFQKARRSLHAKCDIKKGTTIIPEMIIVKRPGYGIKPKFLSNIIGCEAKKFIQTDQWITWDDLK